MSKKDFLKKAAAFTTAGTLLLSGASTVCAGAFADVLKADLESGLETLPAEWDEYLEKVNSQTQASVDLSLHLGNSGSSLIQLFTGLDLTWLDRLGFQMDVEIVEGTENAVVNLYANEQTLATMLMAIDMVGGTEKIMIPELSPNAVSITMEMPDGQNPMAASKIMMDIMKDPKSSLPDGNTAKELLTRYCGLIFDHMQETDTAESDVSVGEISESCTVYTATLDEAGMQELVTDILNTAKEDEQLAEVIKNLEGSSEELSGLYDNMISGIDDVLAEEPEEDAVEVEDAEDTAEEAADTEEAAEAEETADAEEAAEAEETADAEALLTSKIYVNADGKVIGSEASLGEDVSFNVFTPSADGKTGFDMHITSNGETYGIAGIGAVEDGIVNGTYQLMANGVAMANIEAADLDIKKGYNGTITFSLAENMPDEETYGMLGGFRIVCSMEGDETSGNMKLELVMNGETLGDLLITGAQKEVDIDLSALNSAGKVYDAANDEDMAAFASELDLNPILENVTAAGAPEGFVEKLMNMVMGGGEPTGDYEAYEEGEYAEESEEADTDAAA